jgi:UDP-N-acetylglucosamine--N-acetylmuramyl-(pentapeptide) pyrophosphoryl-undecaprenol N-acetylglucosamine transferase
MRARTPMTRIAIACGGTGGHLFPGMAVAEQLRERGCAITLLISPKEVDQQAVRNATGVHVAILPAIGLTHGRFLRFVAGFRRSYFASRRMFIAEQPGAVLAMGGFTSAPPVLAGKAFGIPVFIHESNTIPGRANRWLSWFVTEAFVGFGEAADRLHAKRVSVTGTPVRAQFQPGDVAACRRAVGLDPARPVLLVTGGSQGASALNELVCQTLPLLAVRAPKLQLFHLTGANDAAKVGKAAAENKVRAVVGPFFADMHLALGAATAVISRAGASSLAEIAAMRLPAILVPYPAATDNHQFYNARAFEKSGAARLVEQRGARPELLAPSIIELIENSKMRAGMQQALAQWHAPRAAAQIAESMMQDIRDRGRASVAASAVEHRQSPIS